ncbi:MAG: phosphoribosylanthranilate isomerase [Myxococcota bacterium]|nr:phosphoribosylanthranilate isomerase [Myxococcota bacterium]
MRARIKICCIASVEEARLAVAAGVDALGLVGAMPSGPGVIDDKTAAEIARATPPPVATFLLTSREAPDDVVAHVLDVGPTAVQLVRHVDVAVHEALARRAPHVKRVQVIHVEGPASEGLVERYAPHADAFLLDSGSPDADVLGGTGRAHDWEVSARIVAASPRPVFLAGGLRPDNVAAALARVRPFGVDVCSGVRTDFVLDPVKLDALVRAVRAS